jgi:hypothetical protein
VWVARRRINESRWLRVGTDSIDENVGRPVVGAWIGKPEGKVVAGKMPALPRKITYSFDLEVFSEVSFLSCL